CAVTRAHNYSLQIEWLDSHQPLQASDFLKPFHTRQIDAAVFFLPGVAGQHHALLTQLVEADALFALIEQAAPGKTAYSLLVENYEGAYTATQHLLDAGHQRVAFLDSVQRWPNIDRRWQGYAAAMQAAGLAAQISTFSSPDWTAEGGAMAAEHLVAQQPRATAVLAASDMLAVGAMAYFKQQGLRIPADMAIIGFDDWEFTRYLDPPLSTIQLPAQALGRQAAQLLIDHLEGRPAAERQVLLPTALVLRGSV
ncbi:MAG: substrate-binding domain-containing protein, partial [Chloroflexota bacterium]|nr:substrate-binding domain-containing protein [Chloroflexota bacterium]